MRAWILRQHPEIATNQRGDRKMRELKSVALVAFTFGCAPVLAACAPSSPSTAAESAFDQYVGKTCTGIIHHNELDETGYMGRPGLSPFEIPVVAKFFRTSDGRPGISFKYANRAPVIYIVSSLRDDGLDFAGQVSGSSITRAPITSRCATSTTSAGASRAMGTQQRHRSGNFLAPTATARLGWVLRIFCIRTHQHNHKPDAWQCQAKAKTVAAMVRVIGFPLFSILCVSVLGTNAGMSA